MLNRFLNWLFIRYLQNNSRRITERFCEAIGEGLFPELAIYRNLVPVKYPCQQWHYVLYQEERYSSDPIGWRCRSIEELFDRLFGFWPPEQLMSPQELQIFAQSEQARKKTQSPLEQFIEWLGHRDYRHIGYLWTGHSSLKEYFCFALEDGAFLDVVIGHDQATSTQLRWVEYQGQRYFLAGYCDQSIDQLFNVLLGMSLKDVERLSKGKDWELGAVWADRLKTVKSPRNFLVLDS